MNSPESNGIWKASKDIQAGEELLYDYTIFGEEPYWYKDLWVQLLDEPYPTLEFFNKQEKKL